MRIAPAGPVLATMLLTLATGCSGSSGHPGAAPPPPPGGGIAISITNFRYSAPSAAIHPGDRITVINNDQTVHTLTARNGAWNSGDTSRGAPATFIAPGPGTYTFFCRYHSFMHGTLVVSPR